jgi:hypothetical protein
MVRGAGLKELGLSDFSDSPRLKMRKGLGYLTMMVSVMVQMVIFPVMRIQVTE